MYYISFGEFQRNSRLMSCEDFHALLARVTSWTRGRSHRPLNQFCASELCKREKPLSSFVFSFYPRRDKKGKRKRREERRFCFTSTRYSESMTAPVNFN